MSQVSLPSQKGATGIHHLIALPLALGEREQDAESKVKAVENDVHRDRNRDDEGPDDREIPFHGMSSSLAG